MKSEQKKSRVTCSFDEGGCNPGLPLEFESKSKPQQSIKGMNKLLASQVREFYGSKEKLPQNLFQLLHAISNSYDGFEKKGQRNGHTTAIGAEAMIGLNNELKNEQEFKKAADITHYNGNPVLLESLNDVTGRFIAEEQKEFEKRDKEALINGSTDLIWSVNNGYKLVAANTAFYQQMKASTGKLLRPGDDLLLNKFFPGEITLFWKKYYKRALSGKSFKEERFVPAFNNQPAVWIDLHFNPIHKAGTVIGIACYCRDITEKKIIAEKISQSEAHLAEAQRLAKMGSWDFDIETGALTWSEELYHVFGSDKKLFNETHHSFVHLVDKEDRELVEKTSKHTQKTGESFTVEYRITTPAGEKRIIREHGYGEKNEVGKVTRLFGTAQDITERRKAEESVMNAYEEKNTVLERIDDGFFAFDKNSVVTFWNKRAEILLNTVKEQMIGKNLHEVFAGNPSVIFYDNYQKAIREHSTIHFEGFSKRTNKWFAVCAYGSENGLSVYFKDVTERRNTDDKLKESELRYRSLIEQATDTICIANASLKFVEVNPAGCRMFGYSNDEILQLFLVDVLFEEDLATNPLKINELQAGKTISNERRIKRSDGRSVEVELSSKMLEDGRIIIFGRDISERKKSEWLIKESEAKFRAFFENSVDGILLTVTDGNILAANPAACDIFRMTEEEICAVGRFALSDTSDPRLHKMIAERQLTGRSKGELTLVRKDGSKFQAELTSAVFTDAYGQHRTSMIVRDITERKRVEKEIKENIQRYHYVTKATSDAIWDWDLTNGAIYRGEGFGEIFGYDQQEAGEAVVQPLKNIHPEDIDRVVTGLFEVIDANGTGWANEYRYLKKDQTYAFVSDKCIIVRNEKGKAIRLVGAMQDITKRKREEQHLKLLESVITNTNDSILITEAEPQDEPGPRIVYVNEAFTKMTGYKAAEVIGKSPRLLQGPKSDKNELKRLDEALRKWEPCEITTINYKKNGAEFWNNFSVNPVADEKGWFTHWISIERDVTESKLIEIKLNELNSDLQKKAKELAVSNEELEQFAYVASHDLQEPLRMVTSFMAQLERKYGDLIDDKGKKYIHFAVDGAKRMRQIILDLLEYSRVGRTEDDQENLDLNEMVQELQILFRKKIEEKNAIITSTRLPVIPGYKTPLRQVFQNLISNALKYSRENIPAQIHITAEEFPHHWQFAVADNGIGVSDEYFDKIFILFQRLHNKDEYSGTGMGLAVTKKIVDNLGGKIWVASEEGKGSVFYFTIPVRVKD